MTIAEFIEARITEDETIAHAAAGQRGDQHSAWHVSGSTQAKGIESGGHLETIWEDEPAEWVDGFVVVYGEGSPSDEQAEHIARHDPARVLRQCAALRRVVDAEIANLEFRDSELGDGCTPADIRAGRCRDRGDIEQSAVLRALAAIWSNHPEYQQDWAI